MLQKLKSKLDLAIRRGASSPAFFFAYAAIISLSANIFLSITYARRLDSHTKQEIEYSRLAYATSCMISSRETIRQMNTGVSKTPLSGKVSFTISEQKTATYCKKAAERYAQDLRDVIGE